MKNPKRNFRFAIDIPASTSNLGLGFDVLGLALDLYLRIRVEASASGAHVLLLSGVDSDILAREKSNLILRVAQSVAGELGLKLPAIQMRIHNEIPLARGLGSSAAAIVAGVSIVELLSQTSFPLKQFFNFALEFESHPDNLAACRLGGLTAVRLDGPRSAVVESLPIDRRLKVVAVIPDFIISTDKARRVLPQKFSRADVVSNLQNAVFLSHALGKISGQPLQKLFHDCLHQPFRAALIPGLSEAVSLPNQPGLVGVFLSGSGPTLAALATSHCSRIGRALQNCFSKHGLSSRMAVLHIDRKGRRSRRLA